MSALPTDQQIAAAYAAGEPIAAIYATFHISDRALYAALERTGTPLRRPPRPIARDRYAAEPRTPRQRQALHALEETPDAPMAEIAARAGVSVPYLSRLRRHWLALRHKEAA